MVSQPHAKVVVAGWGMELIPFHAALSVWAEAEAGAAIFRAAPKPVPGPNFFSVGA